MIEVPSSEYLEPGMYRSVISPSSLDILCPFFLSFSNTVFLTNLPSFDLETSPKAPCAKGLSSQSIS